MIGPLGVKIIPSQAHKTVSNTCYDIQVIEAF